MGLLEMLLASQVWACRHQHKSLDQLDCQATNARSVVARLGAAVLVIAVFVAALGAVSDRDGRETLAGSAVAAARQ